MTGSPGTGPSNGTVQAFRAKYRNNKLSSALAIVIVQFRDLIVVFMTE